MMRFEALYEKARLAGMAAAETKVPTPMVVGEPATLFGNGVDFTKKTYFVPGGVCGFAWINVRPGNCSFARWLKKNGIVKGRAYHGGVDVWVSAYGQSMEKKEAYATAFAHVLNEAGIKAYSQSRMD